MQPRVYGMLAEFEEPEPMVKAIRKARKAGYHRMDAFSPFPVEGLAEALGMKKTKLGFIVLGGGLFGAYAGYALQYYAQVIAYPQIIGGRPLHAWPAFIPVTFEMTILCAALSAVLGMLALNGLPRPYHPVFHEPRFELASQNRFFLCIEARDPLFDSKKTKDFLNETGAVNIYEVED